MAENEYEDSISEEDIQDLVNRAQNAESQNAKLNQAINSVEMERKDGNFLHYQVSTDELVKKLEHFYRGDYQDYNEHGERVWKKQDDTELVTFNDFGVTSIMEIISKYIDKNTSLSNYTEQRIYEIISDIGDELILLILCNYEKMGMDTYYKKTKFRMIVTTTTHMIESTYRKAIGGKTLQEVNQSRVVGQFGDSHNNPQGRARKERFIDKIFS
jgi:hypothetical protein